MAVQLKQDSDLGFTIASCEAWADFAPALEKVLFVFGLQGSAYYRGQSKNSWLLWSQLERAIGETNQTGGAARDAISSAASKLREDFKRRVYALPHTEAGLPRDDDVQWLALGRHHGLQTPLLDWTRSPYVAAFFAFTDFVRLHRPEGDGPYGPDRKPLDLTPFYRWEGQQVAIWCLSREVQHGTESLEIVDNPLPGNSRLHAQEGLFTQLTSRADMDLGGHLKTLGLSRFLMRIDVPADDTGRALADLEQMGITAARLFPDFDGAALQANLGDEYEKLRSSQLLAEAAIEVAAKAKRAGRGDG